MFLVQNSTTNTFKSLAPASRTLSPVDSICCFISSFLLFHDFCHHSSPEPHHFSPGQWCQSPDSCLLSWHGTLLLLASIMLLCSRCFLVARCGHITFPGQWNLSRDKSRRKQCLLISLLWWSISYVILDCGVCAHGLPMRMWWSRGPANVMWTWTWKRNKLCLLKPLRCEFCLVVLLFSLTWLIYILSLFLFQLSLCTLVRVIFLNHRPDYSLIRSHQQLTIIYRYEIHISGFQETMNSALSLLF